MERKKAINNRTCGISRRKFLTGGALATAGLGLSSIPKQAMGAPSPVPSALPDLRIKDIVVHVIEHEHRGALRREEFARVITEDGIEGNYTVKPRYWHPQWSNLGWLEYAKPLLVGQSVLDREKILSRFHPFRRRHGMISYISAMDICLWDILGKATGLPIYQLLGACKDRVLAYASTTHMETVDEFIETAERSMAEGFKAIKIHPPQAKDGEEQDYKIGIEVARAVRETVGDDYLLLYDPVGVYNRFQAMEVGRALDELDYYGYEDPIPTNDIDGYAQLCRALDVPIHTGEFIFSIYDYAEYIRRGAVDVLRFIVDNVGGITGGMKIAHLAELHGLMVEPHNWGDTFDHAVHFHCELALLNGDFFEMTVPQGWQESSYMKDQIRVEKDGYVYPPEKPGIGYEVDYDKLDDLTVEIKK
jgi:L-alanine-DL-glutamate epimerase-like enolase superfamily enzyme